MSFYPLYEKMEEPLLFEESFGVTASNTCIKRYKFRPVGHEIVEHFEVCLLWGLILDPFESVTEHRSK